VDVFDIIEQCARHHYAHLRHHQRFLSDIISGGILVSRIVQSASANAAALGVMPLSRAVLRIHRRRWSATSYDTR
jgi:hypothetical protein